MKLLAPLYDIHGNLDALDAVLRELEAMNVDRIVIGGDIAMGPFPVESLDRLLGFDRPITFIRGNADRELVTNETKAGGPWAARRDWVKARLSERHRELLRSLPTTARFEIEGLGPVLFCHGTPRSDEEIVTKITPEERAREIYANVAEAIVVGGHTHVQYDRRVAGKRLVNAGSVGLPYEELRGAYWALLGPEIDLRRTAYDVDRAAAQIRESGMPEAEGFLQETLLKRHSPDEISAFFEGRAVAAR